VKELKRCPQDIQFDVLRVLDEIEKADNLLLIPNIERLTGYRSFYRYRTGSWRVGMELKNDIIKVCLIMTVRPRGGFYKNFP